MFARGDRRVCRRGSDNSGSATGGASKASAADNSGGAGGASIGGIGGISGGAGGASKHLQQTTLVAPEVHPLEA